MSQTHISLPPANEVWGKVIFLHLSVILFTGVGLPGKVPTRPGTPPWQVHPPAGTPTASTSGNACCVTVNKRAVRILLECILVDNFTAIFHQNQQ